MFPDTIMVFYEAFMNSFNVEELKSGVYFTSDVMLDKTFLLLTNSIPLSEGMIKALQDWDFKQIFSDGSLSSVSTATTISSNTTDVDFDLDFLDYDNAYYDKETCEYYNLEQKRYKYTGQVVGFAIFSAKIKHLGQGKIKIEGIKSVELFQHQIEYELSTLNEEDVTGEIDFFEYDRSLF
jgi:hypothetical protein